jgi:diguanylate cyclase (GGDEF)-like protein
MTDNDKPIDILLVEDAKFYRSVLKSQLEKELDCNVICAETFKQAAAILKERGNTFFLALLDLNLPDAPNGEIVEYVISQPIPSIVFSGHFNEEIRDDLMQKNIIDYVIKDSPASIEYVISTVKRIYRNQFIKVLLVDDSKTARYQINGLLKRYKFQVLEAVDGLEALKVLDENPDIMMMITDYNMPNLDGFELTKKVRTHYSKRELSIIGVSTYGNHALSAKFIKIGANDFITKPFLNEEFFCRISQNIEMLEYINALKDSVITDYLTGVRNRRYLYNRGEEMFKEAQNSDGYLIAAMIDLDHFKQINDSFGHDSGDYVLKEVAKKIDHHFKGKGVVARFGGEEFCVLLYRDDPDDVVETFETLRASLEEMTFIWAKREISVQISIGVTWQKTETLDDLINLSDRFLYEAKRGGRNCIFHG